MTPRERSILIAVAAGVVALCGVLLAVRLTGSDGDDAAASGDGGQFIENDGNAELDTSEAIPAGGRENLLSAPGSGDETGAGAFTADDGLAATPDPTPSSSTTSTVAALTLPTVGSDDPSTSSTAASAETSTTVEETTTSSTAAAVTTDSSTTTTVPSSSTSSSEPAASSSTTAATPPPAAGLNGVEQEILRLTNQLRADPAGPLARQKPMPDCVNTGFYGITIDAATGHPQPAGQLTLNEPVSTQLARTWSIEMDQTNNFAHRPNASAAAIYAELGINWSATGENIAWFQGYPDAQAATVFFEGWRESDTGHYCAMVSGTFTHIGVGYYKGAVKSWATQNFYRPQ